MTEQDNQKLDAEPEGCTPIARKWLSTGDMARLTSSTLRTVRFYEAEGLIQSVGRPEGGHRRFPRSELRKLLAILDFREAGLSLHEIKQLMALKRGCDNAQEASGEMAVALEGRVEELERRIDVLKRVTAQLKATKQLISECRQCEDPCFPECCCDCELVNGDHVSDAAHLLWKN